jgi:beta-phosphoglucomutase-like phosphatase (HAD superfamily)
MNNTPDQIRSDLLTEPELLRALGLYAAAVQNGHDVAPRQVLTAIKVPGAEYGDVHTELNGLYAKLPHELLKELLCTFVKFHAARRSQLSSGFERKVSDRAKARLGSIEGAALDMDGCMLDTELPAQWVWYVLLHVAGYRLDPEQLLPICGLNRDGCRDYFRSIRGFGAGFPYDDFKDRRGMLLPKFLKEVRVMSKQGVPDFLSLLDNSGRKRVVGTASTRSHAIQFMELAGLPFAPTAIIGGDDVEKGRGKPQPDTWIACAKRMGLDQRRMLVIEDGLAGCQGVCNMGNCDDRPLLVFIPDLVLPDQWIMDTADIVVADFGELRELCSQAWAQ